MPRDPGPSVPVLELVPIMGTSMPHRALRVNKSSWYQW
jgi:hypothetical protein